MKRHLHWDPVGGASGDMILAALVDLSASVALDLAGLLATVPARLTLAGVTVKVSRETQNGIDACKVDVRAAGDSPARYLPHIRDLLAAADLPPAARSRALAVFERLARAEAKVHGTSPDRVHFHEVGADDALVDIAGTCLLVDALGIETQTCAPLPMAHGAVSSAHGRIPLPAPAVVELISGWPVTWRGGADELVTPTGAALLVTLAVPGMPGDGVLAGAGVGAGGRAHADRPNVLRAMLHEPAVAEHAIAHEAICELVAAVDDATGEQLAFAAEILLGAGALDVYYAPLVMKKGRPGWQLTVLSSPRQSEALTRCIFRHTTTAGVRRRDLARVTLTRAHVEVDTGHGRVRMKVFGLEGEELRVTPEYEDCREIARRTDLPLELIQARAMAAYRNRKGES
jgi:hypothetical protein